MNSSSYISQFTVITPPNTINYTLIYGFYEKKWNNNFTHLNYKEGTDIFAIKFYEDNDLQIPSDFKPTYLEYLTGTINSEHQKDRKIEMKFRMEDEIDGKNNSIVAYVEDNNFFLKTTLGYKCVIKYNYNRESKKEIELKMVLDKNGNYEVCDHKLSEKKSKFTKELPISKVYVNENINLGQILLKTEDDYLYNYKIPEQNITFKSRPIFQLSYNFSN